MKPEKGWIEDRLKHKIGAPLIRFCEKLIPLKLWMRPECAKQVKCYFPKREREGEKKCKNKIKIKKPKKTNMNKVKKNPTCFKYVLHDLRGHSSFHFLVSSKRF